MNPNPIYRYTIPFLVFSASLAGCTPTSSNSETETNVLAALLVSEAGKQCETVVNNSTTFDLSNPIELCRPANGTGRHFKLETVGTNANNAYLNLLIGYGLRSDAANFPTTTGMGGTAPTTTSGDGRWRIFFGKSQSCDKAWSSVAFSGTNSGNLGYHELFATAALAGPGAAAGSCLAQSSGIWGPNTICLDVTKGAEGSSPRVTIWATGKNGADCNVVASLTSASAIYEKKDFTSLVATRDDKNYIFRNLDGISVTKVVVKVETAIKN